MAQESGRPWLSIGCFNPSKRTGVPKLSRGLRRPIISKKEQQKRRAIVIELVSRIDILREKLRIRTSTEHRKEIAAELGRLRRKQSRLSLTPRESKVAPLPSSCVERVKAVARARLSGRDKIRVHFLQGARPERASEPWATIISGA
jgi:hypothetical protein